MRPISEIIIHCTDTRPDWMEGKTTSAKVAEIRRWHTDPQPKGRGWKDIGYHFLIDRDGRVAQVMDKVTTKTHHDDVLALLDGAGKAGG